MELGKKNDQSRRDFLKVGGLAGLGVGAGLLAGCATVDPAPFTVRRTKRLETVRIGFVGVGNMGTVHVRNLANMEGVEIRAVCDIVEEYAERAQTIVEQAGHPKPQSYTRGEWDFLRLCEQEDLDLVYTATPWKWHVPVCLAAMKNGKHAATEVPASVTLDGCWALVETSEKTGLHCVMMENCCYDRIELMILNMVRKGILGELIHAECGYLHDLRGVKFSKSNEGLWRLAHSIERDGDLYPTHGIGPVAQCMNINRGNRFAHLVSMSSKSRGLNRYANEHFGPDSPQAQQRYRLGDVVTTLIRTINGETIEITHDTNSPRPYSRKIMVQGTNGIVRKYPEAKVHIEGRSPHHAWEEIDVYLEEFDHPLWTNIAKLSKGLGHGGMDYIEDYRLVQCLRTGTEMDMDVYDAAAWSAISPLSERSIAHKSRTEDFPDFTRGFWKNREPLGIIES